MTNQEIETLYLDIRGDMIAAARKVLKVREDAEDLVQQVFCDLLRYGHLQRLDTARNARAFVFCRLLWSLNNMLLKLSREPIEPLELLMGDDDEQEEDSRLAVLFDEDRRTDVDQALEKLPKDEREVVLAVVVTGRDFIEVGKALWPGLQPWVRRKKASALLTAGLEHLRLLLRDYEHN